LNWDEQSEYNLGKVVIDVPNAAIVHSIVSCAGIAQHFWWLLDPSAAQNSRRAIYDGFDQNLTRFRDILQNAGTRGSDARDLEAVVAWLLWMHGFSVAHLGGTRMTQDAADLICITPSGQIAVVECTTRLLKADNKLSLLYGRAQTVRRSLDASNHHHLRVLPVLIASRTREDVKADLEQAEKLGILVLTREDLDQLIDRTAIAPNPDQLYLDAEQAVQVAQRKHQAQPSLPLADV
jgi:hypothetical protein